MQRGPWPKGSFSHRIRNRTPSFHGTNCCRGAVAERELLIYRPVFRVFLILNLLTQFAVARIGEAYEGFPRTVGIG